MSAENPFHLIDQSAQPTEVAVSKPYDRIYGDEKLGKDIDDQFDPEKFSAEYLAPDPVEFLADSLKFAQQAKEQEDVAKKDPNSLRNKLGVELYDELKRSNAAKVRSRQEQQQRDKGRVHFLGASNAPSMHKPIGGPR